MPTNSGRPGQVSVTFMATTEQNAALAAIKARRRRDRSFLIREAIDQYLERQRQQNATDEPSD
jgi:predicted transcriptional regulator